MLRTDKFHDECGVVAIFAHPEAEKLAYLGLHALQHRGQESAGIVTSDGLNLKPHKAMGLVADIFTEDVLAKMRAGWRSGTPGIRPPAIRRYLTLSPFLCSRIKVPWPSPTMAT